MNTQFLCADIGTSSLKAAIIDNGQVLAQERIRFSQSISTNTWFDALKEAFFLIKKKLPVKELGGISLSGNGPTLIANNTILLWNSLKSSVEYSGPSIFMPRILTLKNLFNKNFDSVSTIFSGPEFLAFQLTGEKFTVLPEKKYEQHYWTRKILSQYAIDSNMFPPFISPTQQFGVVKKDILEILSLPIQSKIPVFCTGPDFIAALIGSNTLKPGVALDRAGTSEGINLCSLHPLQHNSIRNLPSMHHEYTNSSILIPNTGALFSNIKESKEYKNLSYDQTVVKILNTKNSPDKQIIDSILKKLAEGFSLLQKESAKAGNPLLSDICLSGGQASNKLWCQLKCNALQIPLTISNSLNTELIGDYIVALTGLKQFSSILQGADILVKKQIIYEPKN